jgi:hypothetical protein
VTNLGGARNLSGPLSHRSPLAAPHLPGPPRTAAASAGGQPARHLGRASPAQTGIHGPKREGPGLRLEWESSVRGILQGSWRRVAWPRRGAGGRPTNVGYTHRREKPRYDSTTAAAAADTGIRPATPQRMRHPPRRPPGAGHHHRDCDLPRRIRPAGLDLQLTMAARTRRLTVLCDGGGPA